MTTEAKKQTDLMEKIVALCKRRGFVFQSSEIYGGINGFWDYGPLGAELKRNVKDYWWKCMTHWREDVVGLDATIIMHPSIWKASGHVDTFTDKMVDDPVSKKRYRADQVDPQTGIVYYYSGATSASNGKESQESFSVLIPLGKPPESARKVATQYYEQRGIDKPELKGESSEKIENTILYSPDSGARLGEPRDFNLMLKTQVGPVASDENTAYLRPETAQAIFAQFKNVLDSSRVKVPFGIAQVGKAFRNEVTPRNFTFRSREFEQMELEFFIKPDDVVQKMTGSVLEGITENSSLPEPQSNWGWEAWHMYWVQQRLAWYDSIGLGRDTLELYWQKKEELAHYARACVDILYKFPFGTQELEGIAARGNFDLSQHQEHSGKSMEVFDDEAKSRYIPHVIEPSAGADRLVLALLCNAYHEEQVTDDKGKTETRVVMKFHPRVAPIKVAVFPLLKNKPELAVKAREIYNSLRPHMNVFYDDGGSIGKRYARQDEAGTPFGITVDFETFEGVREGAQAGLKDTVTLRHRDSMKQERIAIADILPTLLKALA
ncbi:MAG: glycine--tRNA ligase [Verrucomicrobiae bacterium]|nr:glycine--tRNA ligase [Verrucomicrobiae bacterium]